MKTTILKFAFRLSVPMLALAVFGRAAERESVYVVAQNGFDAYITAALQRKHVPIDAVLDRSKATLLLKALPVETVTQSTGMTIARCLFANCEGIDDQSTVSVQLIDPNSSKVIWAYSVNKHISGTANQQSMAEAIAKHLKQFLEHR